MTERSYRLAWIPIQITRNTMTKVNRHVLATEIPILEAMYGEGSIQELDLAVHNTAITVETTASQEYERLARIYKTPKEESTTWVQQVYGSKRANTLAQHMAAAARDAKRLIESGPGKHSGLASPMNAEAAANATPRRVDAGDDGAQGEVDGERRRPGTRDQLAAALEERSLKVRVRDSIAHLEDMLRTVEAIEELGATPVAGAGLGELADQLDALEAAADAGEGSQDVQGELEQAANT